LEGFRAPGDEWAYTWPHDEISMSPPGFRLVGGPFDYTTTNRGRSADHWGMPATFDNRAGATVSVWCERNLVRERRPPTPYTTADWHDWSTLEFTSNAPIDGSPAAYALPDDPKRVYLIFRDDQRLFRIEAEADTRPAALAAARRFARETMAYRRAAAAAARPVVAPDHPPTTSR
jgi:hypothetical protein